MNGSKKVIEHLNIILKGELTAINQYFLHSRICKDWGYARLADYMYHESIDEMKHAQLLIDRILFLGGLPNLQDLGGLRIGETVEEQLKSDLQVEESAVENLNAAISACFEEVDHVTRELLESILSSEQEHIEWLETQLNLIKQVGSTAYLTEQIHPKL